MKVAQDLEVNETNEIKEKRKLEIEEDSRRLRNDFKHYIRQVWLFKNDNLEG